MFCKISSSLLNFILAIGFITSAHALTLDITRGKTDPIPIAITNFQCTSEMGKEITQVISADLQSSGLFRPIDQNAFIQDTASAHLTPRFEDWRLMSAQALVTGIVKIEGDTVKVEFRLYDVFAGKQIEAKVLATSQKNWRRIAHMVSDAIYGRITGEQGYFDTRLVYIAESGPAKKRVKRLAIMDIDGHNHHFISDGRHLVLTPRFSPSSQLVTYMAYTNKTAHVYVLDLRTGRRKIVGQFKGMTFAPRFSPDGQKIIMSLAKEGVTSIYTMELTTGKVTQLVNSSFIDTSPSYAPDGARVVFNSDRGGRQQLYVMNADGSAQQRISFDGASSYATPVWSPRGDLIAFTKIVNGSTFYIGVMRPDGTGERLLTQGHLVEGPTWAPNGRVLMFTEEFLDSKGKTLSKIYSIDLTGYNKREILTPLEASDPAWSPLLTK